MARRKRVNSETGVQNIGLKAHSGKDVFNDAEDRAKFRECLAHACEKYGLNLLAFTLMSNHLHLIIEGEIKDLARAFQSLGSTFVRWHNEKYEETGTIWSERYWTKPVQTQNQLINALVYAYRNPVRAGVVGDARDCDWTSWKDTLLGNSDSIVDIERLKELVELGYLITIMKMKKELEKDDIVHVFARRRPTDKRVREHAKALFAGANISSFFDRCEDDQRLLVLELLDIGSNFTQIARISGISRRQVKAFAA